MTTAQEALIARIRELLANEPPPREVSMFGGRSFMVRGKLVVSALKDGGLLLRVAADDHEQLLQRPGAEQAEMGPGREMGPGWIQVAAHAVAEDEQLAWWVDIALAHNRNVTG